MPPILKSEATCKSDRSREDSSAVIGMGATNILGRLEASLFRGAPAVPEFVSSLDVPRLEQEIPSQLNLFDQEEDSLVPRFTLIFDHEGYRPGFMLRMWQKRIAGQAYHR